jgi:hypothetical protein
LRFFSTKCEALPFFLPTSHIFGSTYLVPTCSNPTPTPHPPHPPCHGRFERRAHGPGPGVCPR